MFSKLFIILENLKYHLNDLCCFLSYFWDWNHMITTKFCRIFTKVDFKIKSNARKNVGHFSIYSNPFSTASFPSVYFLKFYIYTHTDHKLESYDPVKMYLSVMMYLNSRKLILQGLLRDYCCDNWGNKQQGTDGNRERKERVREEPYTY